jgi:predicted permease
VDVGFATDVLLASISLPPETYDSLDKAGTFFTALSDRLRAVPGVEAAALATTPPLVGGNDTAVHPEGRPPVSQADRRFAQIRWIQGNYFGALDMPMLRGRAFEDQSDAPGTPPVAVISRRMAETFFPGEHALGRRIVVDLRTPVTAEVVGVAADARVFGQASEPPPLLYLSSRQFPTNFMNIVVRSAAAPAAVAGPLRRAVQELDPALALARVESMRDLLDASVAQPRLRTWLIAGFAAVALLLTLIGLYGILAFSVGRRTKEIGIRLALGATDRQIVAMVLRQGIGLVGIGTIAGLLLALRAGRLLSTVLFEVPPNDPVVFATVAIGLAVSGLIAAAVPARRAARIEPIRALRTE